MVLIQPASQQNSHISTPFKAKWKHDTAEKLTWNNGIAEKKIVKDTLQSS